MAKVKADVVVTYPDESGEWETLKLSRFSAQYLRQALELAIGPQNGTVHVNGDPFRFTEEPAAYAQ
jgi:hypothetical protein